MDPLSIGGGCLALITSIASVTKGIYSFTKQVREAQSDLDAVTQELTSLRLVLELYVEDDANTNVAFPEALNKRLSAIVTNCQLVVRDIEACLAKYSSDSCGKKLSWVVSGQDDVSRLRRSIEAHKSALNLGLDMAALYLAKETRFEATEIRHNTTTIKQDTAQILQAIADLQARLPADSTKPNDFVLQRYLEELSAFTETDYNGLSTKQWPGSRNSGAPASIHSLPSSCSKDSLVEEDAKDPEQLSEGGIKVVCAASELLGHIPPVADRRLLVLFNGMTRRWSSDEVSQALDSIDSLLLRLASSDGQISSSETKRTMDPVAVLLFSVWRAESIQPDCSSMGLPALHQFGMKHGLEYPYHNIQFLSVSVGPLSKTVGHHDLCSQLTNALSPTLVLNMNKPGMKIRISNLDLARHLKGGITIVSRSSSNPCTIM
ncbi:hypothetical protein QBC40DRAFT_81572 [Triangularia verruculosa]|uniref:Azaphilone pigments biosynthesis cluster protein L N-terminal domain-containing protein n=1 Tax=Triangularia verruculosa TaxID=2587418 RepID=A0AAN6XF90_9PEZI|nr:hypothetical protein QBC40DRAFT_81572 [Triangularia verruculosa]